MRLETERLIIDPFRESDREDYFLNISHDKQVLKTFVCRYAETLEAFDFAPVLAKDSYFAIRLKQTGRMIGIILYCDETADACEIGYGLGSGYWGRGYATEAVRRFLEYLFREKGLRTVYASFFPENTASRHVMEKCGMIYDRFSEKELTYQDVPRDLIYYAARSPEGKPVVLLNGPSSSGKSTLAKALQARILEQTGQRYEIVSIDDDLRMDGTIYEDDVFESSAVLCRRAAAALETAPGVILDHVITSARIFDQVKALPGALYPVRVTCPAEELRRREALRGDRPAGSAEASDRYLFPREGYALTVDTHAADPAQCARSICERLTGGGEN